MSDQISTITAETGAVDGTFEAEHQPLVVLEIVTDMAAADHSLRCVAKRASSQPQFRRNQALGNFSNVDIIDFNAPGVTHFDDNLCEVSKGGDPTVILTNVCK